MRVADAFLLPVRRLIVKRLRQVDSRLRGLHVRPCCGA